MRVTLNSLSSRFRLGWVWAWKHQIVSNIPSVFSLMKPNEPISPHQSVTIWIVETPQILAWPIRVRVALAPTFVLSSILIVWNPTLPSITVTKFFFHSSLAPAANVLDQFSNTTFVVAPTLTLASLYPITGATVRPAFMILLPTHLFPSPQVAIVSSLSNGTLSVTDYPGISQSFNPTSGVLTLNTTASGVSVATYQAALRSLAYSNAPLAGDTDIQCSQYHVGLNYLVTNSNRTMPKAAVADVYLNLQQVSSSS